MSLPMGCGQCKGSGMVEVKQNLSGDFQNGPTFRTPMGNVILRPEVTILCDCARGRAMQDCQGGDNRTCGKMPVFDPATMELADSYREKPQPMDIGAGWESI